MVSLQTILFPHGALESFTHWQSIIPTPSSCLYILTKTGIKKIRPYVGSIITTNVDCEGLLKGPNIDILKKIKPDIIPIYVSGGFTTKKDIRFAEKLGFKGVIIGRALYKNILDLEDLW